MLQPRQTLTEGDRVAIRAQLDRMLATPLFKLSKRYPILLRYVVEQTLVGETSKLKERTLGIEVFGRDPDYDTNTDPIVRTTAGEIRKRIAQYYQEPGHEDEIRILFSAGSYIPEFSFPGEHATPSALSGESEATSGRSWPSWLRYAAAMLAGALLFAGGYRLTTVRGDTALRKFWGPVLESPGMVRLCFGQRQFLGTSPEPGQTDVADLPGLLFKPGVLPQPINVSQLYYLGSQNVAAADVEAIARLAGLLDLHGKPYQIIGQYSTSLTDFRAGPVILVGAFNNDWTKRLFARTRFTFVRERNAYCLRDARKPEDRSRCIDYGLPYLQLTEDFAIVSRVFDPDTGKVVVNAAGLTGFGTAETGEFLSDEDNLAPVLKMAPPGWEKMNLQIVLATKVIQGSSGHPRIVDVHVW